MTSSAAGRSVTAVILAAGEGRRYADQTGQFKLAVPLADGRALVRAVCETALEVTGNVIVVQRGHSSQLAGILQDLPVRHVVCASAAAGMGASLKCGVRAALAHDDLLLMLADMPFLQVGTVREVRRALLEGAAMARPFFQGRPGHPVGFSYRMRDELLGLDDSNGAAALLRSRRTEVHRIDSLDGGCVHDVDVPSDLLTRHS